MSLMPLYIPQNKILCVKGMDGEKIFRGISEMESNDQVEEYYEDDQRGD